MSFINLFFNSVTANKMVDTESNPSLLIPNIYEYDDTCLRESLQLSDFLHLLAGGNIKSNHVFSYSFQPINCYLMLYTETGGGHLTISSTSYSLSEHNLFIIDCRQFFKLQTAILPWNFKLFFIDGKSLDIYRSHLFSSGFFSCQLEEHSTVLSQFVQLIGIPTNCNLSGVLQGNRLLTNILTTLFLMEFPIENECQKNIPSYLLEMKDQIDHHYKEPFFLQQYEDMLGINKYRLCREFSKFYGNSPLRYLNNHRLQIAKEMLLTSDLNVYEISSMVGYDNVNHFINLFKKHENITPNAFKQKKWNDQFS